VGEPNGGADQRSGKDQAAVVKGAQVAELGGDQEPGDVDTPERWYVVKCCGVESWRRLGRWRAGRWVGIGRRSLGFFFFLHPLVFPNWLLFR